MRIVTTEAARALKAGERYRNSNTKVMGGPDSHGNIYTMLTLHDNVIATYGEGKLTLTDSGWRTLTTKDRLNGVLREFGLHLYISQRKGVWYLVSYDLEPKTTKWGTFMHRVNEVATEWTGIVELTV